MMISILLCFDRKVLSGAGVTISSMITAAAPETTYEIHVFHPDLTGSMRSALGDLLVNTRHRIIFHRIDRARFAHAPNIPHKWSEIVYFRLLASEILTGIDRVIYSDVDVFVRRDLGEIFLTDLQGSEWGGIPVEVNAPTSRMHTYFPENEKAMIFTSALMVADLRLLREEQAVKRYFRIIAEMGPRLRFFDLDVLNIASRSITPLPLAYGVFEDIYESEDLTQSADYAYLQSVYTVAELEAARADPAIIHFAGRRGKPWQRRQVPAYYRAVLESLPPILRRRGCLDWRKRWLSARGWRLRPQRSPS